jgi:hypothetical protein
MLEAVEVFTLQDSVRALVPAIEGVAFTKRVKVATPVAKAKPKVRTRPKVADVLA